MRWSVVITLALLVPTAALSQEPAQNRSPQPRNQLPTATAEPDNAQAYAPPAPRENAGPSDADRGPAQQHFVLASKADDLGTLADPPRVGNLPPEKIALDKRIKISLIHDVENGSDYKGGENHALLFEIKYINWGAVTREQLEARKGHYFTISWVNHGPPDNFIACFQYRQVKSQGIIRTLQEPMPHVDGGVRSYFGVVNQAYLAAGPVASWRFTVRKAATNTVVAEAKSYIW